MLLDEPTNHLDLHNQMSVLKTVQTIVKSQRMTAIVAMHDLNLALRFADRYIFMKDQQIYAAGGEEVVREDIIEAVYGLGVHLGVCEGHKMIVPK